MQGADTRSISSFCGKISATVELGTMVMPTDLILRIVLDLVKRAICDSDRWQHPGNAIECFVDRSIESNLVNDRSD